MIHSLGIRSVELMTNNPRKLDHLARHDVEVTGRIRHVMPPNEHNRFYLETKAARSGHWLDLDSEPPPPPSPPVLVPNPSEDVH